MEGAMPLDDVIGLMQAYARRGISDWRSAKFTSGQTQQRARMLLKNQVAEREDVAMHAIASINGTMPRQLFIPMPNLHKGIQQAFFLPLRDGPNNASFDLLLLCSGKNCLGFRFEPPQRGTHRYAHIQMNQKMLRGDQKLNIDDLPGWVPTSYPAFPMCTSDPVEMFLAMTTSVHGYEGGITDILREALAKEPGQLRRYLDRLATHLDV
jgi:hypothetical protein